MDGLAWLGDARSRLPRRSYQTALVENKACYHGVAYLMRIWDWFCPVYVPVSELIYAAFRSKAKGLFPPSDEWRRRGL